MFTKLYLYTTNPNILISEFFTPNIFIKIVISILVHTIIYTLFLNLGSFIFTNKLLDENINIKIIISLILIMFFGFIARYYHVKDIFKAYNGDMIQTRNHLDKLYISWIFIS
jgi:hypothetical protein